MSLQEFEVVQRLRGGGQCSVLKVVEKVGGQVYFLKKARVIGLKKKQSQKIVQQLKRLAAVVHPNLLTYHKVFIDKASQYLCLVMEFQEGGNLQQLLRAYQRSKQSIPESQVWITAQQVLLGLSALHSRDIIHYDIKGANILLTQDGFAKLGEANPFTILKNGSFFRPTGTPYYGSPEAWNDSYIKQSDIWSLGCLLFEMCTLRPPFVAEDMQGLYNKIVKGKVSDLPPCYSHQLFDFIRAMLTVNPKKRPSCDQLLAHPRLKGLLAREEEEHSVQRSLNQAPVSAIHQQ